MQPSARSSLPRFGLVCLVSILGCLSVACGDGGDATSGTAPGTGGEGGAAVGPACPAEREKTIGPVDKVSDGAVTVLSDMNGVKTLYIDASAGGVMEQANFPWIYVNLATASRVDITDAQADTSLDWDLALKRPVIRTNSGLGSKGDGGAAFLKEMMFDAVTKESAGGAPILVEDWFDDACMALIDAGGYTRTTFDGWYDYAGQATHGVTPHPGVFIVRGAKGALYKIELINYYANPDGTTDGMVSARFLLRYASL